MAEPQSVFPEEERSFQGVGAERLGSSFRDPSGFVFQLGGELYRQINPVAAHDIERLVSTGLYEELTIAGLLVKHETVRAGTLIRPERVPFISYPYEWCFSQLQDAAQATLEIQRRALAKGMSLKDASAYNIQFLRGKPVLIDTLSFERYEEGQPWVAYRQFCRHFLAPLALMSLVDSRLSMLQRTSLDGVALSLASKLLPWRTRLNLSLLFHLHLHGKHEDQRATISKPSPAAKMPKAALLGLVDALQRTIERLRPPSAKTEWADYYQDNSYSDSAMAQKKDFVSAMLDKISGARTLWDLGANTGEFARLASAKGIHTVAWDLDPAAVEQAYRAVREKGETNLLPLCQDLMNPSGNLGWAEHERDSMLERGPADAVMALALIHHLAIANNVPLSHIAAFLAQVGEWAIVEWVPKDDPQVQRLLASRKDVFEQYDREHFEAAMNAHFQICRTEALPDSGRLLYLLRRH